MLSPRLVRALAAGAAAVALAALPAAAAGPATAAPASTQAAARFPLLPPIGAEVPSSMLAINSLFEYRGTAYSVDFRGGIKQRVDVNPDDPINSVRLRTVGFRVSAEIPGGGSITLEQNDVDVDPKSILRITSHFPPKFDEHDVIPVSATVELPGKDPVVLNGIEPLRLSATGLSQYPARGDRYLLDRVLDFATLDRPGTPVARLVTFDSKRGGL
ncbi:hypothetical protein OIE62_16940 [Streptomyces scopuliridis]|uniref:Uncharacterized protein n=1 Tax=Streptomyces scopuliridis TaxID=452529 RepID=A0ACD4ZPM7_9ACTN|nr:hypothetical protein [Streptomyces scopuliridis]WSB35528.1 hypothetical protein OG949_23580 [Streptomyces scopuliridis]WSB99757.1 hypothetical protein OG835_24015 [Streptomyces scopuliridis]WSC06544.1 hypothetical protein OIE62_16940 [Streptomyces scopuliridis]